MGDERSRSGRCAEKRVLVDVKVRLREATEHNLLEPWNRGCHGSNRSNGDRSGEFDGEAVDAGADTGEGQGANRLLGGQRQARLEAGRQEIGLALRAAAPPGSNGVEN